MRQKTTVTTLLIFLAVIAHSCGLEILLMVPGATPSISLFNVRLATLLQKNGHSVTYLINYMNKKFVTRMPENMTEIIEFEADNEEWLEGGKRLEQVLAKYAYEELQYLDWLTITNFFDMSNYFMCRQVITDDVLSRLRQRKFQLILTHCYAMCSVGIGKLLDVPVAWISNGNYVEDNVAWVYNLPFPASYVPEHVSSYSDSMTFEQRKNNLLLNLFIIGVHIHSHVILARRDDVLFESHARFRGEKVSLPALVKDVPSLMLNGERVLDFPRPLLYGVRYLGELAHDSYGSQLSKEWEEIVAKGKDGIVYFSLGTSVKTAKMPASWLEAFIEALKRFPNHAIIWKVDTIIPAAANISHLHMTTWAPQRELLGHPRMKLFITHGGYNSLLETSQAGVPALLLPLAIDQYGNAKRAQRLGFGLSLDKQTLTADNIEKAMREVLNNSKYKQQAKAVSNIINDRIVSTEVELVAWINQLAKNRTEPWQNIVAAHKLSWTQYYCLDVLMFFLLCCCSVVYIVCKDAFLSK